MATTNIQLSTPAHGANVDTWDSDPINDNSNVLDAVIGGTLSLSATSTTLSVTQTRNSILKFSGVINTTTTITLAAIVKSWTVINQCTGTGTLILSTGTGNVIGLPDGAPQDVVSDGTNLYFKNLGAVAKEEHWDVASLPSWVSACTVAPYLLCDGSTFSSGIFPALFKITGTTALPDARGRTRFNLNGGTGRITNGSSSIDGDVKLSSGGAQVVTLDTTMIPAHTHDASVTDPGHTHPLFFRNQAVGGTGGVGTDFVGAGNTTTTLAVKNGTTGISVSTLPAGGGLAHNNMPPTYIGGITVIRAA